MSVCFDFNFISHPHPQLRLVPFQFSASETMPGVWHLWHKSSLSERRNTHISLWQVYRFIPPLELPSSPVSIPLLLSHFSRVWLCATPWTAAHQSPPSLGFSRQEHWNGLPFPSPMHESEKAKVKSLSRVQLLVTPWTVAYQAPPSMGFSRQERWSGLPLPSLHYTLFSFKNYLLHSILVLYVMYRDMSNWSEFPRLQHSMNSQNPSLWWTPNSEEGFQLNPPK